MQAFEVEKTTPFEAASSGEPPSGVRLEATPGLMALHRKQADHPLWKSPLLRAFATGALTRDDMRFVFSQYYEYSSRFTRYVAAVIAKCEDDLFRAELSRNLWDEGGGADPSQRHTELFRTFLRDGLGIYDLSTRPAEDFARVFAEEYLSYCLRSSAQEGAAFLSLGTEGIVARLYGTFIVGLRRAGVPDDLLSFFYVHIETDDDHAQTLERLVLSYADQPGWFDSCERAMTYALDLRARFFDALYAAIEQRRLGSTLKNIRDRISLMRGATSIGPDGHESRLTHHPGEPEEFVYRNVIPRLNIEFSVTRLPLPAEVLDPRVVHVPPGKCNERHRHAHETMYYVVRGRGRTTVDGVALEIKQGDCAFVPRWAVHQTENVGEDDLVLLAITDCRLTDRVLIGAHDPRMRGAASVGR